MTSQRGLCLCFSSNFLKRGSKQCTSLISGSSFFWGVPWEAGNGLSETKSELCTLWIFHILMNGSKLSFRKASQRRHVHHRAVSASDKTQDSLKLTIFLMSLWAFFQLSCGEMWREASGAFFSSSLFYRLGVTQSFSDSTPLKSKVLFCWGNTRPISHMYSKLSLEAICSIKANKSHTFIVQQSDFPGCRRFLFIYVAH